MAMGFRIVIESLNNNIHPNSMLLTLVYLLEIRLFRPDRLRFSNHKNLNRLCSLCVGPNLCYITILLKHTRFALACNNSSKVGLFRGHLDLLARCLAMSVLCLNKRTR